MAALNSATKRLKNGRYSQQFDSQVLDLAAINQAACKNHQTPQMWWSETQKKTRSHKENMVPLAVHRNLKLLSHLNLCIFPNRHLL